MNLKVFLSEPYGRCIPYGRDGQPFNASSHTQCYQSCLNDYIKRRFNCFLLFIDNFNHENDLKFKEQNSLSFCSLNESLIFEKLKTKERVEEKCRLLCPKDCIQIEYSSKVRQTNVYSGNEMWFQQDPLKRYYEKKIIWDTTQPSFKYIEEPLMTFTDYLVYCGGLLGLWFGTSAKDILIYLSDNIIWRTIINKLTMTITVSPFSY